MKWWFWTLLTWKMLDAGAKVCFRLVLLMINDTGFVKGVIWPRRYDLRNIKVCWDSWIVNEDSRVSTETDKKVLMDWKMLAPVLHILYTLLSQELGVSHGIASITCSNDIGFSSRYQARRSHSGAKNLWFCWWNLNISTDNGESSLAFQLWCHFFWPMFFSRFCWWYSPGRTNTGSQGVVWREILHVFMTVAEIFRRSFWAILRIEYEQVLGTKVWKKTLGVGKKEMQMWSEWLLFEKYNFCPSCMDYMMFSFYVYHI